MSDNCLPDTPDLAERICPVCEPGRDPCIEILVVSHCAIHQPSLAGLDDAQLGEAPLMCNSDTDLVTQMGMAALLREGSCSSTRTR